VGSFARKRGTALLARIVDGADDASLERRFGSTIAQRAMFMGMARSFEPSAAGGFQGRLVYELARPATGAGTTAWTIQVLDGAVCAQPGRADDAALTVRFPLADFVRVVAGLVEPAAPVLGGRASFEGDFGLAARLPEMFGAPSAH
jgi:SCP-2 sterol transfer family